MKERVLVTGGAGYLGNVLIPKLLDQGYRVTCLDNLLYRQSEAVFPLAARGGFEFVHGDARDKDLLKRVVPEHDAIIPLAAIVGFPACNARPSEEIVGINTNSVLALEELRSPQQKLVFPNTNSGYGTRSGEYRCDENTPLEPISLYGQTKCEAERAITSSKKGGTVFRLASVFGLSPRMRLDLSFHDMVWQALTKKAIITSEGDFTRNYVYIGDVADAFVFALKNYGRLNGVYNLGCDSANISKMDLARSVQAHIPGTEIFQIEDKDPDKRNYLVSNVKLRRAGFEALTSIDHGIEEVTRGLRIRLKNNPDRNI